jgi:hypothetical protein
MGFRDMQEILVRLMTDPILREQFLANPQPVAAARDWPESVVRSLLSIPPDQLRRHGETLIRKRCGEAMKCLPLTLRVIGPIQFRALFRAHASASWPSGPKRHRDDAVAFASMIREETSRRSIHPSWVGDLAAYEAELLRMRDPKRRWGWLLARHDWSDLAKAALAAELPAEIPVSRVAILWIRATRGGSPRSLRLRLPGGPLITSRRGESRGEIV